jgi:hypothetical protein
LSKPGRGYEPPAPKPEDVKKVGTLVTVLAILAAIAKKLPEASLGVGGRAVLPVVPTHLLPRDLLPEEERRRENEVKIL